MVLLWQICRQAGRICPLPGWIYVFLGLLGWVRSFIAQGHLSPVLDACGAAGLALASPRLPGRLAYRGHGRSSTAGSWWWRLAPSLAVASRGRPPLSSSSQDCGSGGCRCQICPPPGQIWHRLCPMHGTCGVAGLALDGMGLAGPKLPRMPGLPGSWLVFPRRPPSLPVANRVWPPLSGGLGWVCSGQLGPAPTGVWWPGSSGPVSCRFVVSGCWPVLRWCTGGFTLCRRC